MRKMREQLRQVDKESLIDIILELREQISQMAVRIQTLEDQLAKNSDNSSKPPSSDGLKKKKPAPQSLREVGKRKTGGQKGHKGETLKMMSEAHHIEVHSVRSCPECQADLSRIEVTGIERRHVFDVPPIEIEVTLTAKMTNRSRKYVASNAKTNSLLCLLNFDRTHPNKVP
jgi:transposase